MATPFDVITPSGPTILEVIQQAAAELKEPQPSTLDSTSRDVQNFIAAANREGQSTRRRCMWPSLTKRYTYTVTATDSGNNITSYPLPIDFDRQVFDAFWQQGQFRPMMGPLTMREWEQQQNGIASTYPTIQFRLFGVHEQLLGYSRPRMRLQTITVLPTDEVIVFPFQSMNWLLPTDDWVQSTAYTQGEYIASHGNVYLCELTGTSQAGQEQGPSDFVGGTDGTTSWTYSIYDKIVEDGARPLLDYDVLVLGIKWRWLQSNGFDYEAIKAEHEKLIRDRISVHQGAQSFSVGGETGTRFFGWENVPITGWGE